MNPPQAPHEPLVAVKDVHAFYGKSHILHGVQLTIGKGEIVSLLGRNGVGRSTTIRAIMGLVDCTGSVRFADEEMLGLKAYEIAHKGEGVYYLLLFTAAPETLSEISRVLKITDGVMRHLAVRRVKGGQTKAPAQVAAVSAPADDADGASE